MLRKMRSVRAMIDSPSRAITLLGGTKSVADSIGRPLTTVASWVTRESIPVEIWPDLIALADKRKVGSITYKALTLAHAAQAPAPRRQPKRKAA